MTKHVNFNMILQWDEFYNNNNNNNKRERV